MKKTIFRYGCRAGIAITTFSTINWFLFSDLLDYSSSEIVGYLSILVALSTIPLSIRYYQQQHSKQPLSLKEIWSLGIGISTVAATFMYLYSALFFHYMGDDFMQWTQANMDSTQWQQMQAQMATMPSYFLSPWFQAFVMFATVFLIGVIITIICTLVVKLRPN
ncbi:DUF4199 domain-containing protein [Aureispira sp. CCB-E]|uniref:DUF4199 domain-containing protein n=1 Tax=Aureispira sp. CCB-E TaxID=3051121 RepID=UPI002868E4E6|nr:DUF4199 domain-containing protein [Aureispira sp. CCB-E]WMX13525.1 DUF4199 domain-containing protein [Aureispira sp. CCB-E]